MTGIPGQIVLFLAVPIFVFAASLQRLYLSNGRMALVVIALILFTIGNALMFRVMRDMGLGMAISVATIGQLILINLIAYFFFQERPTQPQLAGMALGLVSMVLLLLPRGEP